MRVRLVSPEIKQAAAVDRNEQFRFIVGDREYKCCMFQASFISKKVYSMILMDPSIDCVEIETKASGSGDFSLIESLWNGNEISVDDNNIEYLLNVSYELRNESLYRQLGEFELRRREITVENALSRLQLCTRLGLDSSSEVEFIASRFTIFRESDMSKCSADELEKILLHSSLKIEDEKSLFEFIVYLTGIDKSYSVLLRYIRIEHLDHASFNAFMEFIFPDHFDIHIWNVFSSFVCVNHKILSSYSGNRSGMRYDDLIEEVNCRLNSIAERELAFEERQRKLDVERETLIKEVNCRHNRISERELALEEQYMRLDVKREEFIDEVNCHLKSVDERELALEERQRKVEKRAAAVSERNVQLDMRERNIARKERKARQVSDKYTKKLENQRKAERLMRTRADNLYARERRLYHLEKGLQQRLDELHELENERVLPTVLRNKVVSGVSIAGAVAVALDYTFESSFSRLVLSTAANNIDKLVLFGSKDYTPSPDDLKHAQIRFEDSSSEFAELDDEDLDRLLDELYNSGDDSDVSEDSYCDTPRRKVKKIKYADNF